MVIRILFILAVAFGFVSAPVIAAPASIEAEQFTWSEFHADAVAEYLSDFDSLFNSYETKWAKNGRLMIRSGSAGRYSFAKMG